MKKVNKPVVLIVTVVAVFGLIIGGWYLWGNPDEGKETKEAVTVENSEEEKGSPAEDEADEDVVKEDAEETAEEAAEKAAMKEFVEEKLAEADAAVQKIKSLPENAFEPWEKGDMDGEDAVTRFTLATMELTNWLNENAYVGQDYLAMASNNAITPEELESLAKPLFDEYKAKLDELRSQKTDHDAAERYKNNLADALESFYNAQYIQYELLLEGQIEPARKIFFGQLKEITNEWNILQGIEG